jgi:light-regulated signal transduction histidine kinase (bacteriophytochrome)
MLEQALRFAGLTSGNARLDLQPCGAGELVDGARAACGPETRAAGCEGEQHIPEGLPDVAADRTAISHCRRNQVENAVTRAADGRWVGIRAQLVDLPRGAAVRNNDSRRAAR